MPFRGESFIRTDGIREGGQVWQQSQSNREGIQAPSIDHHDNDVATALAQLRRLDGTGARPTGNLPMNARRHTNVGDATERNQYAAYGQLLDNLLPYVPAAQVSGTATAITITPTPSTSAYVAGAGYRFTVKLTNTGALTLTEGSKSPVELRRIDGTPLQGGELEQGMVITVLHNGAIFVANVGRRHWVGTEAQFNALPTKYDGVLYYRT